MRIEAWHDVLLSQTPPEAEQSVKPEPTASELFDFLSPKQGILFKQIVKSIRKLKETVGTFTGELLRLHKANSRQQKRVL